MSSGGFLGAGEALKRVLAHDAEALQSLSMTKTDLASKLSLVVAAAREHEPFDCLGQTLTAKRTWYMSQQLSPFFNAASHSALNCGWSEEWKIRNKLCPDYSLLISGSAEAGILVMISECGFFEGGLNGDNKYRIDPHVAVAILSGRPSREADAYTALRISHRLAKWKSSKSDLIASVDPNESEEAQAFFTHQVGIVDAKITKLELYLSRVSAVNVK